MAKKILYTVILAGVLLTGFLTFLSSRGLADAVVQGYQVQGTLKPGWIVALVDKNTVKAAPANDITKIYGVVVDPANATVIVNNQDQKVYVATSGDYPVLVTNENGPIVRGDYISMSATDGIGAKSVSGQAGVLGQALGSFDGVHSVITKVGDIAVGEVLVRISIGPSPGSKNNSAPAALQRIASSLSGGKNVSSVRIYAGLVLFLLSFMAAVSLVWSGVKNGMISIGRNPLSRGSIITSLTQVILMSVVVFAIGLAAVYLILRF